MKQKYEFSAIQIAWIGDSITAHSDFQKICWFRLKSLFPESAIVFHDRGVPGDSTTDVVNRFHRDICGINPHIAFLMLGMNDSAGGKFNEEIESDSNIQLLNNYKENIVTLIENIKRNLNPSKIVLVSPSPYDEEVIIPPNDLPLPTFGRNKILQAMSHVLQALSKSHHTDFIDNWNYLNSHQKLIQSIDPFYSLTPTDRVHPCEEGHRLMATQFLNYLTPYVRNTNAHIESPCDKRCTELPELFNSGINITDFRAREKLIELKSKINQKIQYEKHFRQMGLVDKQIVKKNYSKGETFKQLLDFTTSVEYNQFLENYQKELKGLPHEIFVLGILEKYSDYCLLRLTQNEELVGLFNDINELDLIK